MSCLAIIVSQLNISWNCVFPPTSALIRPGRFDMQVTVPRPDVKGRTEILKWYLNKIKYDPCEYMHLHVTF